MLKVYGQIRSRAFRVLWLCNESNIPFEHIPVSIHTPSAQAKEDWYLKLNPNARIPTIDDDGFIMWESAAINLYLARKYKSPLWPTTPEGEGRAFQWTLFVANDFEKPAVTLFQHSIVLPPERRDAAVAKAASAEMVPQLKMFEGHLSTNCYFGGDRWDLSDFMVASVASSLLPMKYDLSAYPKFAAWLKASVERPAAVETNKLRV